MSSESEYRTKRACLFPQRYIISVLMGLIVTIVYDQYLASNMAFKYMVLPKNDTNTPNKTLCEVYNNDPKIRLISDVHYNWDQNALRLINYGILCGFYSSQIPGGIISDKYGGKLVLEIGLISSSVSILVTPVVLRQTGGNHYALVVLMFIQAAAGGAMMTSVNAMLGHWSPPNERCRVASFTLIATQLSGVINFGSTELLIVNWNSWSSIFYLLGGLGVGLCLVWHWVGASRPSQSFCIDEDELKHISDATAGHVFVKKSIPWLRMLRSLPLWVLIFIEVAQWAVWISLMIELPIYFDELLGHDRDQDDTFLSLAFLVMVLMSISVCWATDHIIEQGYVHVTTLRKIFATFGSMGPIIFLLGQTYLGCEVLMSVVMLSCSVGLLAFSYSGQHVNALDLAPNYGGTLKGIINAFSALSSVYVHILINNFAPNHTLMEWRKVYWFLLYGTGICNFAFMIFASGEEQAWNSPTEEK